MNAPTVICWTCHEIVPRKEVTPDGGSWICNRCLKKRLGGDPEAIPEEAEEERA